MEPIATLGSCCQSCDVASLHGSKQPLEGYIRYMMAFIGDDMTITADSIEDPPLVDQASS
jgi:hypothetical protein